MKPQFSNNTLPTTSPDSQLSDQEHGVTIPIVAGVLLALILLIGLALDSGNLYRARIRAQKVADAAAFAAAAVIAIDGPTDVGAIAKGKSVGVQVGRLNLRLVDMPSAASNVTVNYNMGARTIDAQVDVDIELFLLSAVPGMGRTRHVPAAAQVVIQPAIVAAIVDTSGSMACTPNNDCSCYPCPFSKATMLKQALTRFTQHLDSEHDYLSVTRFATGADTSLTMPAPGLPNGGFDRVAVQAAINSIDSPALPAQAYSNFCDGFQQGYSDTLDVLATKPEGTETFVIALSDFDPDAGRFSFANPKPAMPTNNVLPGTPAWANYDYNSWKADFTQPLPLPGTFLFTGPQSLVRSKVLYEWPNGQVPPDNQLNNIYPEREPPPDFNVPIGPNCTARTASLAKANPFTECLNDWSFNTFETTWKAGEVNWAEYEKRYFDCAIAWSDYSRRRYGIWYSVGFGQPCPPQPAGGDPYQGASSPLGPSSCNHDIFARRIAFSRSGAGDPAFPDFDTHATMVTSGYDYGDSTTILPGVDVQERMDALFGRIARRIKLRLIQ